MCNIDFAYSSVRERLLSEIARDLPGVFAMPNSLAGSTLSSLDGLRRRCAPLDGSTLLQHAHDSLQFIEQVDCSIRGENQAASRILTPAWRIGWLRMLHPGYAEFKAHGLAVKPDGSNGVSECF